MKRYAFAFPANRRGELEFLSHNQQHWSTSLKQTKQDMEDSIKEQLTSYDPPLTREEALQELGGPPVLYELKIKEI